MERGRGRERFPGNDWAEISQLNEKVTEMAVCSNLQIQAA